MSRSVGPVVLRVRLQRRVVGEVRGGRLRYGIAEAVAPGIQRKAAGIGFREAQGNRRRVALVARRAARVCAGSGARASSTPVTGRRATACEYAAAERPGRAEEPLISAGVWWGAFVHQYAAEGVKFDPARVVALPQRSSIPSPTISFATHFSSSSPSRGSPSAFPFNSVRARGWLFATRVAQYQERARAPVDSNAGFGIGLDQAARSRSRTATGWISTRT